MRTDAKKNLKKVATAVVKNPLASQEELASMTGLSQSSVSSKLVEVGNIDRTSTIVSIEEADLCLVTKGQELLTEWMNNLQEVKRDDANTINNVTKESQKRYSMLSGEKTDEKGGEKINPELQEAIDGLLKRIL